MKERSLEEKQLVIADMIRINQHYHDLLNLCTTQLFKHLNDHNETNIPYQAYSDNLYVTIERFTHCLPAQAARAIAALMNSCNSLLTKLRLSGDITRLINQAHWDGDLESVNRARKLTAHLFVEFLATQPLPMKPTTACITTPVHEFEESNSRSGSSCTSSCSDLSSESDSCFNLESDSDLEP